MSTAGLESRVKSKQNDDDKTSRNLGKDFNEDSEQRQVRKDLDMKAITELAEHINNEKIPTTMGEKEQAMVSGIWKGSLSKGMDIGNVDEMETDEKYGLFLKLGESLSGYTKGDQRMGLEIHLEMNEEKRNDKWIEMCIIDAQSVLIKVKESIEKESTGDEAADAKNKKLGRLTEEKNKLGIELATIKYYYSTLNGIEGIVEHAEDMKDFISFNLLRTKMMLGNEKVLNVLSTLKVSEETSSDIQQAKENPLGQVKQGGLADKLELASSATKMIDRIRTKLRVVTPSMYMAQKQVVQDLNINYDNFKEDGGFKGHLRKLNKETEKRDWMGREVQGGARGIKLDGLIQDNYSLEDYWELLEKIGGISVTRNKTTGSGNYLLVQNRLLALYQEVQTSKLEVREKLQLLQTRLLEIDSNTQYLGKKKEFTLNTYEKPVGKPASKPAGKGKGKGKGERFCIGILRKGQCDRPGCEYKTMNQQEYNEREECGSMKKNGSCSFGTKCKYRHPNDPKEMTKAMMSECVHNGRGTGRSANAAEEIVYEGDGSTKM